MVDLLDSLLLSLVAAFCRSLSCQRASLRCAWAGREEDVMHLCICSLKVPALAQVHVSPKLQFLQHGLGSDAILNENRNKLPRHQIFLRGGGEVP